MVTSFKAVEMIRGLQEELNQRLGLNGSTAVLSSTLTFEALSAQVSDAVTLHPVLLIGSDGTTTATCRIVIKPIEWALAFDVLGLASPVYTPHEILWGFEHSENGNEYLSTEQKAIIVSTLARLGCRLTVFRINTGDSFDTADFLTANIVTVIEPSTKYPMVMSQ
jgi:hypothetical protein